MPATLEAWSRRLYPHDGASPRCSITAAVTSCVEGDRRSSSSPEQSLDQVVAAHPEMLGNVREYRGERADAQRIVARDGYVVLAFLVGGEAHVAAGLAGCFLAERPQRPREVGARQVPGEPHRAISSSLTKWSRIMAGASP